MSLRLAIDCVSCVISMTERLENCGYDVEYKESTPLKVYCWDIIIMVVLYLEAFMLPTVLG
jgi:hypothetical protein